MTMLYGELASWWPLLSPPADYADEAAFYHKLLRDAGCAGTLLELGSGGGNTASHLKTHFHMTLVDASAGMLAVSRGLNPECAHIAGDMRSVRLATLFDGVLIQDAVAYMTSEADLAAALRTSFVHCRPGGVALFVPDYLRETFVPGTAHGGCDGPDRALRFLEWTWDPDPGDSEYLVDFAFLLREAGGVRVERDRHACGLFARADWLRLLREAGFQPRIVLDPNGHEVLVASKPDA
jgi:SAM-dependent methyltransferase